MDKSSQQSFHMHLVSDATGETIEAISRAVLANFADCRPVVHGHFLVRTAAQTEAVGSAVAAAPGIVFYTMADARLREKLHRRCSEAGAPCVAVLDHAVQSLSDYLHVESRPRTGAQHEMNARYFSRIAAVNFAMRHDDGQMPDGLGQADVILVGVSRSSKTPTSIYLANRGIKAANVPYVSGQELPYHLWNAGEAVIIGLTAAPKRISEIRRSRMLALNQNPEVSYSDRREVLREIKQLEDICSRNNWPVINVSKKSIEEIAAEVIIILKKNGKYTL